MAVFQHTLMRIRAVLCVAMCLELRAQTAVDYIGGTTASFKEGASGKIELTDDRYFAFYAGKTQLRVPYERVNLLEYGQQVDRRLALAVQAELDTLTAQIESEAAAHANRSPCLSGGNRPHKRRAE